MCWGGRPIGFHRRPVARELQFVRSVHCFRDKPPHPLDAADSRQFGDDGHHSGGVAYDIATVSWGWRISPLPE